MALVFLVNDLVSHILGEQADERSRSFFRLAIRSLMDEGEFTRLAIQGGPLHWVQKVAECIEAAKPRTICLTRRFGETWAVGSFTNSLPGL